MYERPLCSLHWHGHIFPPGLERCELKNKQTIQVKDNKVVTRLTLTKMKFLDRSQVIFYLLRILPVQC